jgi:hypothetical protein
MSDWLGTPYTSLPDAKVLKKGSIGYTQGIKEGRWITWNSRQDVEKNHVIFKSWSEVPYGYEGTKNLIKKISSTLRTSYDDSFIKKLERKNTTHNQVNYWDTQPNMRYEHNTGFAVHKGGIPCLVWQVGLGGDWCIATKYGIAEGVEVSIRSDHEWRLRQGLKIGHIWFLPQGENIPIGYNMKKLLSGITVWNWNDVSIDIWGEAIRTKFDGRFGIPLGEEIWSHIGDWGGCMKIYKHDVITDGAYGNERPMTDWIEDMVYSGRNVGLITPRGFRIFTTRRAEYIEEELYHEIYKKVRQK